MLQQCRLWSRHIAWEFACRPTACKPHRLLHASLSCFVCCLCATADAALSYNGMGCPEYREQFYVTLLMLEEAKVAYVHLVDGLAFGFHKLGEFSTPCSRFILVNRAFQGGLLH
jgi:hypothetical protein